MTNRTILPSQNTAYGFYGTVTTCTLRDCTSAVFWTLASTLIAEAVNAQGEAEMIGIRDFLDSKMGRHFADGAGTAGLGMSAAQSSTYYSYGGQGGAGLLGSGGRGAGANSYSNNSIDVSAAESGGGFAIFDPNLILLGGGGGGGNAATKQSSEMAGTNAGNGGPGAGGGSAMSYSSSASHAYMVAGNGGILGGGGGAGQYSAGGHGGNAGGGGGSGYQFGTGTGHGFGGDGLIILQYALIL